MTYTAIKPCNFGGVIYMAGHIIPNEAVDKTMVKKLVSAGKISVTVETAQNTEEKSDTPNENNNAEEKSDAPNENNNAEEIINSNEKKKTAKK